LAIVAESISRSNLDPAASRVAGCESQHQHGGPGCRKIEDRR
jgi:hypothetical protein